MFNIVVDDSEIKNSQIKEMLKSMSKEEIKKLFINFLEKDLAKKDNNWSQFANSFDELNIPNISDKIAKTSKEFRESFELREINE